jgi:hypothetical protein
MPRTSMPSHHNATTSSALNSIASPRTAISAGRLEEAGSAATPTVSGRVVDQATRPHWLARLGRLT